MVPKARHNGWNDPLDVHRVICACPGLRVTMQVHRRSAPTIILRWVVLRLITSNQRALREVAEVKLILPPGSYVNVLKTQIHRD